MNISKSKVMMLMLGLLALIMAFGVTAAFAQSSEDPDTPEEPEVTDPPGPLGQGRGGFGGHGFGGRGFGGQLEGVTPLSELFAQELEALGVTVEELQTAHEQARAAAIEDGVFPGRRGFDDNSAFEPYLSDALAEIGLTIDQLEAAHQAARDQWLAEMLEAGYIDEDQLALDEARRALKEYIDREALVAGVLGMNVDELQAAREAGVPLSELLGEKSYAEFADEMQAAYEAAVQEAAEEGVIDADLVPDLLANGLGGRGFGLGCLQGHHGGPGLGGGPRGFGGRGGFRGYGSGQGIGPAGGQTSPTGVNI